MLHRLAGGLLLAGVLAFFAPAEAASTRPGGTPAHPRLDPLALVPEATVVALGSEAAITSSVWAITASATGVGSIVPTGAVNVLNGGSQTFVLKPDFCARVTSVLVDGIEQGPVASYAFTNVTAPHNIVATFAANPPDTVRTTVLGGGRIEPGGVVSLACGSTQTFQIIADSCSLVSDVLVDGRSVGAVIQYTLENLQTSHRIEARFTNARQFAITATAGPGGSIGPAGSVFVNCGRDSTFHVVPGRCFAIEDVLVDDVSVGPVSSYTFTHVLAPHRIVAHFKPDSSSHVISATAGPGGTITPSGDVVAACGTDHTYSITHERCYAIQDVLVDGVSRGPVHSVTFMSISAPHTISVTFVPAPEYTITASADVAGLIAPSGAVVVPCGGSQTFTIRTEYCQGTIDVLVDGVSRGSVSSITFEDVNDPHEVLVRSLGGAEVFAGAHSCLFGQRRPIFLGGPLPPDRDVTVSMFIDNGCLDIPAGTPLDSLGSVHVGADGFISSTLMPCVPGVGHLVVLDVLANGRYDPGCDVTTCYDPGSATGIAGIQGLEATLTADGPEIGWWLSDPVSYSGFRIHRSVDGGGEELATPEALAPPGSRPPVHMTWRDATALEGHTVAYRVEAVKSAGSDWFGPVELAWPGAARELTLRGATPNPFSRGTQFAFELPTAEPGLRMDVFDIAGRHVRELHHGPVPAGRSVVEWDGTDDAGSLVRAGLYVVRLHGARAARATTVVKMN